MNAEIDIVERLFDRLAVAIRQSRRPAGAPVSVSEIYQELVPYRDVREDVGFAMNADYEHTLLRLLAGEGGFARLEPHTARDTIRDELCLPNPNVGMYRDFAGCDVFVRANDDDMPAFEPADDPRAGFDEGVPEERSESRVSAFSTFSMVEDDPADDHPAEDAADDAGPTGTRELEDAATDDTSPAASSVRCAYCDSALPTHRSVRFCPYCGADQTTRPCNSCGESLEPGWTFCVACGSGQDGDSL